MYFESVFINNLLNEVLFLNMRCVNAKKAVLKLTRTSTLGNCQQRNCNIKKCYFDIFFKLPIQFNLKFI